MKIVVDVFGCDDPAAMIRGVAKTVNEVDGVTLLVAGKRGYIEEILQKEEYDRSRVEILDADEVIDNSDSPMAAVKSKKNSSLAVAMRRLKEDDEAVALVSCGNTGAVLGASVFLLGRSEGISRPALATLFPADNGKFTCLADCGANVDCRPEQLLRFAEIASDYVKSFCGVENPKVALLSVGTEDKKGNEQTRAAFALLKESSLNFVGNMEAKTALTGDVDVIVSDGFAGNVLMKGIEGTAKSVAGRIAALLKQNAPAGMDMTFVKKAFGELQKQLDFNSMGGAVLLGVEKIVVKGHGSANEDTVVNTVKQAIKTYEGGFCR